MTESGIERAGMQTIRQAQEHLEQHEVKLYQIAALLHRLYYKSKAQHRSAKWFQSIEGMRKCFSRLLNMSNVVTNVHESLPDKGVDKKSRASKHLRITGQSVASVQAAKVAIVEILNSQQRNSSSASSVFPLHRADSKLCEKAALKILVVSIQLEELVRRSRFSFKLMQLHLRTPPAPTFAPLVIAIMSLCAEIHSTCQKMLWDERRQQLTFPGIYSLFRSQSKDLKSLSAGSVYLDASSPSNKARWNRMLRRIDQSPHKDLQWLPQDLLQPKAVSKGILSEIVPQPSAPMAMMEDLLSEGEDLGEAL